MEGRTSGSPSDEKASKCEATDEFPRISWVEKYELLRKKTELARCQNLRENGVRVGQVSEFRGEILSEQERQGRRHDVFSRGSVHVPKSNRILGSGVGVGQTEVSIPVGCEGERKNGKDWRIHAIWSELGKTTGLLMRMLSSYFSTGRYVVLDSGFCVLKALVELKKVGLFACAVIKKRRYWPAYVPGNAMIEAFAEAQVGDSMAISGTLDGQEYFLWGLKEPSYVMKMMATGGPLLANESCGEQKRKWMEGGVEVVAQRFRFPCPYDWQHYKYHHAVNDHNNLRHALPSIEATITTIRWEIRVFSFVLAVTEVNAYLAYRFFCHPDPVPTLQQFRHKLAWELIKNKWLAREDLDESHLVSTVHQLMVAPLNATKYVNGRWQCYAKQPHQNYPCTFKHCGKPPKRIKTYCSCCPTKWICKYCHAAHVVSELKRE